MSQAHFCKTMGCSRHVSSGFDFCGHCSQREINFSLSDRYPTQYKSIGDMTEIDSFAINHLFKVEDPSGCIQSAITKLLLCTNSRGTTYSEVRIARDALTRWLQLNQEETA